MMQSRPGSRSDTSRIWETCLPTIPGENARGEVLRCMSRCLSGNARTCATFLVSTTVTF
jgi:hypothetical protein